MKTMKKSEAFEKMVELFGEWRTWGRAEHIAYGLIRGIPYERMERCSNDNPHATSFEHRLWKLGAWPEHPYPTDTRYPSVPREIRDEASALVKWVKKEPRVKKEVEAAE